jgi:hypothetical protein
VTRLVLAFVFVLLSALAEAQDSARTLQLDFTASADPFRAPTDESRAIWAKEGPRIVAAMERITGPPLRARAYTGQRVRGTQTERASRLQQILTSSGR